MEKKHIDEENLTVSGVPSTRDSLAPYGVTIAVTKAYGPKGDSLVGISDVTFDGQPAVTLFVKTEQGEGLVHLSPLHGDRRKTGYVDIPAGTRCQLFCPVSKQPLDKVGPVDDGSDAEYYAIYLTPQCSQEAMVAISDIWGHYASRIVDDSELISYWARTHENA